MKLFTAFYGNQCSLAFSQQPAKWPSAEQERSDPGLLIHFLRTILISPSKLRLAIPRVSSWHLPHHKPLSISPLLIRATRLSYWLYHHVGATAWLQAWRSPTACASPLHSSGCLGFPGLNSTSNTHALILSVSSNLIPSALHLLGVSWQELFCRARETASRLTTYWWIRPPYLCPSRQGGPAIPPDTVYPF